MHFLMLVALATNPHWPPNDKGDEKSWPERDSNQEPLAYRARAKLLSQWPIFDISPSLIRFVPESDRNYGTAQRGFHC